MTSERFVKKNRTACVVADFCYGAEWPTRSFVSGAFWSSLRVPNQSVFIAGFSVNLKLNITPLQLSTLITCSEPEVEWLEATRRFFAGLQYLGRQTRLAQTSSLLLYLSSDERLVGDFPCQNRVTTAFFLRKAPLGTRKTAGLSRYWSESWAMVVQIPL